jgi:hypothetical protein
MAGRDVAVRSILAADWVRRDAMLDCSSQDEQSAFKCRDIQFVALLEF